MKIARLFSPLLSLALAAALAAPAARAQTDDWPSRPARIVVTFPPGGVTDVLARQLADGFSKEFGQQFIVENRPGAGGTIGLENVVNSKPDGYTSVVIPASFATIPALYRKLSFDPVKSIAPVATLTASYFVLVVHPSVKAASLKELLELARAQPRAINFGSAGLGTDLHLALELFQQLAGIEIVHVPYKGFQPALTDLLGGRVHMMLSTPLSVAPHVKSGKLRVVAVTTDKRAPATPEVPAVAELVPGYEVRAWWGLAATAGTPAPVIAKLNQAAGRILRQPEVQERLRAGGVEPAHSGPDELARLIARDTATWSKVVQAGNIKVE